MQNAPVTRRMAQAMQQQRQQIHQPPVKAQQPEIIDRAPRQQMNNGEDGEAFVPAERAVEAPIEVQAEIEMPAEPSVEASEEAAAVAPIVEGMSNKNII